MHEKEQDHDLDGNNYFVPVRVWQGEHTGAVDAESFKRKERR